DDPKEDGPHKAAHRSAARPRGRGAGLLPWNSAPVAVEVARQLALDVVPAVAHRTLGLVPLQAGLGLRAVPVALQVGLDVLELLAAVLAVGVIAVLVGRLVVVPLARAVVVRTLAVGVLEV